MKLRKLFVIILTASTAGIGFAALPGSPGKEEIYKQDFLWAAKAKAELQESSKSTFVAPQRPIAASKHENFVGPQKPIRS